mgnify:CR=1 FL=1
MIEGSKYAGQIYMRFRRLQQTGYSPCFAKCRTVNRYLTPDENHNGDGRHVKYLKQKEYKACDEVLWQELKNIVESNHRKACYLENERILHASFYSERLDFTGKAKTERESIRGVWHNKALATLAGNDVICVDPDNGLIVPSAVGKPKENKYVMYDELADYYAQRRV